MIDQFFSSEIDHNIRSVDLHDMMISTALEQLEQALYRESQAGTPYVRVVHGIGTGALKSAIHGALAGHPLVLEYKLDAHGGSTTVLL
jgi:DNA mismatch repair protein MutS2